MMSEGDAIIERMYECMDLFSEATNAWFKHAFNAPTEAQRLAWPAIRSGENVLVVAPTGNSSVMGTLAGSPYTVAEEEKMKL